MLRAGVLRARERRQWMLDDLDLIALRRGLRFREADVAELGIGEDRRRQHGVVRAAGAVAEHVLDGDACLVLSDGREHRTGCNVAGGPDPVDRRALAIVDDDAAARYLDADPV